MTKLETVVVDSKDLRPRTKELYLQHVRAFLAFAGGRKWTPGLVIAWRDDMRLRRISPQSVNVALNALRFAALKANRKFFTDAVERLPVRKKTEPQGRPLTWSEGRKLITACDGSNGRSDKKRGDSSKGRDLRDRAIITLGLRTGMLRFSMCQLRLKDITTEGLLTFEKKGGEKHTIKLDEVTRAALCAWIDWLTAHDIEDGHLFRSIGRERISHKDGVSIGDQLTPDGLYRALRERAQKANIEDLHPHTFRKTFLAWIVRVGAKPAQIEAVTGHKSDGIGDEDGIATPPANMLLPDWSENLK